MTVIWSCALAEMKVMMMLAPAMASVAVSEQCEEAVTPGMLRLVEAAEVVVRDPKIGMLAPDVPPTPSFTGLLLSVFRFRAAPVPPVSITRLSSAS